MKLLIVTLALVAVAASSPVGEYVAAAKPVLPPVNILRSVFDQQPEGSYSFGFESDDGTIREETGVLKEALDEENKPHTVVVVRGSYTYINPEGKPETINYVADENGFHAEGASIPKVVVPVRR